MHLVHSDQGFSERTKEIPSIFLAGPSPRGYGEGFPPDWRDEAFKLFEQKGYAGRLFVPRPTTGNATNYDGQIEWELHHLDLADVIMFWVPRKYPETKGATTNVEYGLFIRSEPHKVVYGRPDDADQIRYLDHLYKKYAAGYGIKEPTNTLQETVHNAFNLAHFLVEHPA